MGQFGFILRRERFFERHNRFGMGDSGRRPQKDGRVELFADLKSQFYKFLGFLRIRRFQHGDFGKLGIIAVVLFVLRAVHGRIIGADDDQSTFNSGVAHRENRIGCDVDADMLHHSQRSRPAKSCTDGDFHRHFFIGGPLRVNTVVFCEFLEDFRAGSPRITGAESRAAFKSASGNGLVSRHQYFHKKISPCPIIPAWQSSG